METVIIGPVYPFRGGIAHHTTLLARALKEQNHQVHVVSFRRQYPAWLYPGISDKDPSKSPIKTEAAYLLDPMLPWTWWKTAWYIKKLNPVIVLIEWWSTFWAPAFAVLIYLLKQKGITPVFFLHNVLPHERHLLDARLTRSVLSQGKFFIVGTRNEEKRLLSLIPCANIEVCPLAIDELFPQDSMRKDDALQKLKLEPSIPLILFFGIVRPYKGLNNLFEALGILHERNSPFQLVVAGEVWGDIHVYTQQIDRLSLGDHVKFDNRYIPNEEMPIYFSAADIFVAPYIEGSQSNITRMASEMGLPLVATRHAVGDYIKTDPPRGIIILDEPDPVQLAEAISALLHNHTRSKDSQLQSITPSASADWKALTDTIERIARSVRNE